MERRDKPRAIAMSKIQEQDGQVLEMVSENANWLLSIVGIISISLILLVILDNSL